MGLIYADLEITNPVHKDLTSIKARVHVATGALLLCIPKPIATQLQLKEFEQREVNPIAIGADGTRKLCSYVGPVYLKYAKRQCPTGAMAKGEEVLLGAIQIEDMDLNIHPAILTLVPNSDIPNITGAIVK